MPDVPIVDSHVHLWDPTRFRMGWLDGNEILDRPYGLSEYQSQTAGLPIEAMVYLQVEVEPPYALLEVSWVAERAREDGRIKAMVPWAPLEFGEQARAFLEALKEASPLVTGIRRLIQSESLDFCVQPRFVRGVQLLPEYGLSFDLCIYHRHLPNAIELVRQCPNVSFILDHIGKPNIKDHAMDPWRDGITALAAFPNVMCKLSGMATEADFGAWTPDDLRPYVDHVLASFGTGRVAFGGDWPVVLQASTYRRWVETLDGLTQHLSTDAKRKLWGENAARFYRFSL